MDRSNRAFNTECYMNDLQFKKLKLIARKNCLSILDNTGLVHDGRITSSNLDTFISYPVNIVGSGVISLSAIEKPFSYGVIADGILTITRGMTKTTLAVQEVDEFPVIPECDLLQGTFRDANEITRLKAFADKDLSRIALSCIHINDSYISATDAHKVRWVPKSSTVSNLLIPPSLFSLLTDKYSVWFDEAEIPAYMKFIGYAGEEIVTRTVTVNYPNIKAVIPAIRPVKFTINTTYLLDAIAQTIACTEKSKPNIYFRLIENVLQVSASNTETNATYSATYNVLREGYLGEFHIYFDAKFLKTIAEIYKTSWLTFEMHQSNRPVVINANNLLMPTSEESTAQEIKVFDKMVEEYLNPEAVVIVEGKKTKRKTANCL